MKIISRIDEFKQYRRGINRNKIGFVPTMGYLHDGHLSLIDKSLEENQATIVSIFVNPAQFGPGEDLDRYPRDFTRDRQLLEVRPVDCIFFPDSGQMYGANYATFIEVKKLETVLCGKTRPTHFRGVTTVVLKLFNLVQPTTAYFGQKDAQQAIIIKRMVTDLDLDLEIRVLPIVRDDDGLALSSRNRYLSDQERQAAVLLPAVLSTTQNRIGEGRDDSAALKKEIEVILKQNRLIKIDYIEIVSLDLLEPLDRVDPENTLVAVAIRVGGTRLIDNFILGEI